MVRDRRQGFGQFRFGRREGRHGIGHKGIAPSTTSARADPNERVDIVGIGGERAIEKAARLRHIVRGQTLIEPSQTLKIEVHRVGVRGLFRASRLGGDELGVQRAREARDDFVLHVEEIGERLVEPLGPEMIARFGVDELHVDAHAVSAALDAALEDIADVQLAADRLHVERLALVGERRIAGDHEGASNAREVGRQALRDPVDEMLLLRVAADIGERQDDDREARRGGFFGRWGRRGLRLSGLADVERIDPDRLGDVLELGRAEIGDGEIEPPFDLTIGVLGEADRARLSKCLRAARRY